MVAEAEENNLGDDALNARYKRWYSCSLCKQMHHGVVKCALGWACWKTYVGRPEMDWTRRSAMTQLGVSLAAANHNEEALSVKEAQLAMMRRIGDSEINILAAQGNLAITYECLGGLEQALEMKRDVYSGHVRLHGEENIQTISNANNYVYSLVNLQRFEEAKALQRKTLPVTRRVCGENHEYTLKARLVYGETLYKDPAASLDDLRGAVTTLEDTGRIARRVFGGTHPLAVYIVQQLQNSRAALAAREATGDVGSLCDAVDALNT